MNLSARSYAVAGAATVAGIVGQWSSAIAPAAWLALALPWLAGLAWEWRASRRADLGAERHCPDPLHLGRREQGEVRLHNRGARSLQVEWEAPEPDGFAPLAEQHRTSVAAGAEAAVTVALEPRALGSAVWPPLRVRIAGPAGLAWWRHDLTAPLTATVAPETLADRRVHRGAGRSGQRPAPDRGAGMELIGLRDYVPGDPLRSVDWKATARRGKPVVRRFADDQQLELVVAVDAGRRSRLVAGELTRFGHYVNIAAQLAEHAVRNGDRAAVLVFADGVLGELPPGHGTGQLTRLRGVLGAAGCAPRESNPLVAALGVRRLLNQRGLVVFLTDLDETEAAGQLAQATRLLAPKHLPLIGTLDDPEHRAMEREPADGHMAPYRRLAALEFARERRLVTRRLQRMGARVVSAAPQRLAGRLLDTCDGARERHLV